MLTVTYNPDGTVTFTLFREGCVKATLDVYVYGDSPIVDCPHCQLGVFPECIRSHFESSRGPMLLGCEDCIVECDSCYNTAWTEDGLTYGQWCDECGFECEGCNSLLPLNSSTDGYCNNCCWCCPRCGNSYSPTINECESCQHNRHHRDHRENTIRSYSYKPTPIFHHVTTADAGKGYYGIELEMECVHVDRYDAASKILDATDGFCYVKADCSLANGIECVSHPASFEYWTSAESSAGELFNVLDTLRGACQSYDTDTCGMHIHASRDKLSPYAQYRLAKFAANNPTYVFGVSRRTLTRFERYCKNEPHYQKEMIDKAKGGVSLDRYVAFNFLTRTIECRIFRGTIEPMAIKRNLAWLHCLLAYARAPTSTENLHVATFRNWTKDNMDPAIVSTLTTWDKF